jgi:hypothetical protein
MGHCVAAGIERRGQMIGLNIDGDKMTALDDLVLRHYLVWFALTTSLDIEHSLEYRTLKNYLCVRGLVIS